LLQTANLNRGKPVAMMRKIALFGEFPASLMFEDVEPAVLAEEEAEPITWSAAEAAIGWHDTVRQLLPSSVQRNPPGAALFLLATRSAQAAQRYAAASQSGAVTRDDLAQVRFWHDVLVELGRIAAGS
jgi:hypothetical protein